MKWHETYRINSHDTDANGIVRASAMLRYHQETANLQLDNCHPTPKELLDAGLAFILSRVTMTLKSPVRSFETIEVDTWGCPSHGATYNRCGQIFRGSELIAEVSSVWGLLSAADKRILRVGEVEMGFGTEEAIDIGLPTRFRIPRELELHELGKRTVTYGDIDTNIHMNNTNYPDMLCGFLPTMQGIRVSEMSLNFVGEAHLGETITVMGTSEGEYNYFRTIRENGDTGVEAILRTIPIEA